MFDSLGAMPLHPLVIHAVVVGIPLSSLLALLFVVPRTWRWARWPLVLAVVAVTPMTFAAKETGRTLRTLQEITPGNPVGDLIAQHAQLADELFLIMLGFMVIALVNVFAVTPSRTGLISVILRLLLVTAAVAATLWVVRVGDVGARAVWNPDNQPTMVATRR